MTFTLPRRLWLIGSLFGAEHVCVKGQCRRSWDDVIEAAVNSTFPHMKSEEKSKLRKALKNALTGDPLNMSDKLDDHLVALATELAKQTNSRKNSLLANLRNDLSVALDQTLSSTFFSAQIEQTGALTREVFNILEDQFEDEAEGQKVMEVFFRGEANVARAVYLTNGQKTVRDELNATMRDFGTTAVHWPVDTLSGAAFVASCLPSAHEPAYETVYLLHPGVEGSSYERRFDSALRALARALLAIKGGHPCIEDILYDLAGIARATKGLVVFANANCLSKSARPELVQEQTRVSNKPLKPYLSWLAANQDLPAERPCPDVLFLSSQCPKVAPSAQAKDGIIRFCDSLSASTKELHEKGWHYTLRSSHNKAKDGVGSRSFIEFYQQWESFCEAGDAPMFFRQGNRLKVSYFWYVSQANQEVWQRSIVMRAAAASNAQNMGFFDATLGLNCLLGDMQERKDISSYIRDVETQLSLLNTANLRALRHIAAANYWASENAIKRIFRAQRPNQSDEVSTGLLTRNGPKGDGLINEELMETGEKRYRATLDVKAIVLDHWRKQISQSDSPTDRDEWRMLFRFAARDVMEDAQRSHDQVREIPTNRYIGVGQQVWPEVFRKLIRSVEHMSIAMGNERPQGYLDNLDQTPLDPDLDYQDPRDVYRVCFKKIFIEKFRRGCSPGNIWFSADDRADTTAAEMLQLLSQNMVLGKPHPWLDGDLHQDYQRACAVVLHAIGYTKKARESLSQVDGGMVKSLFLTDSLSKQEIEHFLNDLCKECGVTLCGHFPMWSEFHPQNANAVTDIELLFLSILFLGLRCRRYSPNEIELALADFTSGERLISDGIEPRYAHKLNWAWDRAASYDSSVLLIRLLALFHERSAEAQAELKSKKQTKLDEQLNIGNPDQALTRSLQNELEEADDSHYRHLVKAQAILNTGIHRLSELNRQNERMRLMVARQRIERLRGSSMRERDRQGALFRAENILNEMMRRALDFGCAYDIYLDILLEGAKTLKSDSRPLRAYAAYARPALEIAVAINYVGHVSRAVSISKDLLLDIEAMHNAREHHHVEGGRSWDEIVANAVSTQARVEFGHGMPIEHSLLGSEARGNINSFGRENMSVFGFLLPRAHQVIKSFTDYKAASRAQANFLNDIIVARSLDIPMLAKYADVTQGELERASLEPLGS